MTKYQVKVDGFEELAELEQSWVPADYIAILTALDIAGAAQIEPADLRDMCLFALQDQEPPEAAAMLLKYKLGGKLTAGQIRNYSIESQHESLWEQSPDLDLHQSMFAVASLLNAVNSTAFPTPDALRVSLSIQCNDITKLAIFNDPMDRTLLVRMLSAGMNESAILNRLFSEQISAGTLKDADSIIWKIDVNSSRDTTVQLKITSSAYWLKALWETDSFEWDCGQE